LCLLLYKCTVLNIIISDCPVIMYIRTCNLHQQLHWWLPWTSYPYLGLAKHLWQLVTTEGSLRLTHWAHLLLLDPLSTSIHRSCNYSIPEASRPHARHFSTQWHSCHLRHSSPLQSPTLTFTPRLFTLKDCWLLRARISKLYSASYYRIAHESHHSEPLRNDDSLSSSAMFSTLEATRLASSWSQSIGYFISHAITVLRLTDTLQRPLDDCHSGLPHQSSPKPINLNQSSSKSRHHCHNTSNTLVLYPV